MALFQNLKVILGYVHQQPSLTESVLGLKLILLFSLCTDNFFIYPLLKFKKKYNLILLCSAL